MSEPTLIEDVGKGVVMGLPFGGPIGAAIGGISGVLMHYAPDLIGGITGQDTQAAVATAERVSTVVKQITGGDTTAAAMEAARDPAIDAQLQIALATIDREIKQADLTAHLAELTAHLDDHERARQAEIVQINRRLDDVAAARATMGTLVEHGSPIAWAPAIVTGVVLTGFFSISAIVLFRTTPVSDVALLVMGALIAMAKDSTAFWTSSTSSSQAQREQIVKMADRASQSVPADVAKKLAESVSPEMVRTLTGNGQPPFPGQTP